MKNDVNSYAKTLIITALALISFAGCNAISDETQQTASEENIIHEEQYEQMARFDFSDFPNVELINADLDGMTEEQLSVLYQQARYCQAMTDADTETLRQLVSENTTFTHMSGRKQTREEYFADIENGNLKYFMIGIDSPIVTVNGNSASVTFTSVLNANAYGARGTYRMSGTHFWEKKNGKWVAVNKPNKEEIS